MSENAEPRHHGRPRALRPWEPGGRAGSTRFAALATSAVLALTIAGCHRAKEVPEHLLGVWVTDHADFVGRSIEILPDAIIFGQGRGRYSIHPLEEVHARVGEDAIHYRFVYTQAGAPLQAALVYLPSGTLTLENRRGVHWHRVSTGQEGRVGDGPGGRGAVAAGPVGVERATAP